MTEKLYVDNVIRPRCDVEREVQPGDVVQLKSGGPKMTATGVSDVDVACLWFNGGLLQSAIITKKVLTLDAK